MNSLSAQPNANDVPPETVIAQDPPAGAAGVEKPSVALLISDPTPTGSAATAATYVMPDFTGHPYVTAAATITHAGLKLAPEIYTPATTIPQGQIQPPPGTVIAQTPLAGYSIDPNTPIQLTVIH